MKGAKPGFTLIELLVVIAIIGLLATFAIVQMTSARDKAKLAKAQQFSHALFTGLGSEASLLFEFDECSGTVATDRSGYLLTGALVNSPAYSTDTPTGKGCALSFDGSNQYISVTDAPSLNFGANQNFTIALWIKTSVVSDPARAFIGKFFSGVGPGYGLRGNSISNQIEFWTGPDASVTCTTCSYADNKWHHIAAVRSNGTKYIYFDGSLAASGSLGGATSNLTNAHPLYIGTRNAANDYAGLMDEVLFFSSGLNAQQVGRLYAQGRERILGRRE